jgi:hypothetical protein
MLDTKDEALKMAIDWMDKWHDKEVIVMNVGQRWVDFSMPIQACKEALEQPAWQGLTDDEVDAFFDSWALSECTFLDMYTDIEQALKEKNT